MAVFTTTKTQKCGIALGGIGTGTVELFPDGEFHQWQIANPPRLTSAIHERKDGDGEAYAGSLSFFVRAQEEGRAPVVRRLGMKTGPEDFTYRMYPWNKPVEKITFDGRFPVCDLTYEDSALPVSVSMRATAPFVPHHTADSATPGFYLDFTLKNTGKKPVTVSLLSALEPAFCNRGGCINKLSVSSSRDGISADGGGTGISANNIGNSLSSDITRTEILLDSPPCEPWEKDRQQEPDRGSVCLSAEGENISFITADHFRFLREYVSYSSYGVSQESFLFGFRETGELPNTTAGAPPREIPHCLDDLKEDAVDRLANELMSYPFALSQLERVRHIYPDYPHTRAQKQECLNACRSAMRHMGTAFGSCALCGKKTLAPGETMTVRFILSWYFPNHFNVYRNKIGHWYENRFSDAGEANRYLSSHREEIAGKARTFSGLLFNTSLPEEYPDAWSCHLSTIIKDSWYTKDGRFAMWEGLGYCGLHTTDITYFASFGLLALFPDLQLRQMEMGAAFQRGDGRVPDLSHVDNGFDRVDMNDQFVLMVCRDYLYTGNRMYLERMWEPVVRAMDSIEKLDTDLDGLPDNGTERNTYDAWDFSGTPVFISILWLAALTAAIRLAEAIGDEHRQAAWRTILDQGKESLEKNSGTVLIMKPGTEQSGTLLL